MPQSANTSDCPSSASVAEDELERRLDRFVQVCRDAGLKMTPQRLEVYREVARTHEHPDADTVLQRVRERLPTISADTIYRTLLTLARVGVVTEVSPIGSRRRFDANTRPHHHFVCERCGLIHDFYSEQADDFDIPDEVSVVGDVAAVQLQLRGVCHRCREAAAPDSPDAGESLPPNPETPTP